MSEDGQQTQEEIVNEFAQEIASATTPETPAEPAPAPETPESKPDATPETPAEAEASFREIFKGTYGIDLGTKYQDDDAALRGLAEAYRAVGRRDEDATIGRMLRENPQAVLERYGIQAPPKQTDAAPQATFVPLGYDEMKSVSAMVRENPDAVPAELVERYQNTIDYLARKQYNLAFAPDRELQPLLQNLTQQQQETLRQYEAEQQQRAAFQQEAQGWKNQNKDFLLNEKGQFTPLAYEFERELEGSGLWNAVVNRQIPFSHAAEMAKAKVMLAHLPRQQTPTPPPTAEHRPNVANPPAENAVPENASLQDALVAMFRQQGY